MGGSAVHTTLKKLNMSLRGGAAALSGASLLAGRSNLLDNERLLRKDRSQRHERGVSSKKKCAQCCGDTHKNPYPNSC